MIIIWYYIDNNNNIIFIGPKRIRRYNKSPQVLKILIEHCTCCSVPAAVFSG